MQLDSHAFRAAYPHLSVLLVILKRLRAKAGFVLVAACLARELYLEHKPVDPTRWSAPAATGWALIGLGLAFRLAASAAIRKKECLATQGIYSLCRHPLYLGSMLLTYGFCVFWKDWLNFVVSTLYFAIFYSLLIFWEEARLSERYGALHSAYAQTTPLLLPFGRFRANPAGSRLPLGTGIRLFACISALLILVDVMAGK